MTADTIPVLIQDVVVFLSEMYWLTPDMCCVVAMLYGAVPCVVVYVHIVLFF